MDDFELIKLIKNHRILYDNSNSRGLKNAKLKDAAWKDISSKLCASERACITRWKSIRDRFGKEFRRVQEHPDEPTSWDIFPHLLFLKQHYKHGTANIDVLESIKFEPKERRRKVRAKTNDNAQLRREEDMEEMELDPDDIALNQQLIDLVKKYPVLYDRQKIRDSKNITAKNNAWHEISMNLNVSEEMLYKRWKKLRDRFSREYRNHQINTEAPITWIYFHDLLFLESHYRKGVPLVVENLKRRGRPPKNVNHRKAANTKSSSFSITNDNNIIDDGIWGTEYPDYSSADEETGDDIREETYSQEMNDDEVHLVVTDPENSGKYIEVKTSNTEYIIVPPDQLQTVIEHDDDDDDGHGGNDVIAHELNYTHSTSTHDEATVVCQSLEEPAEKLSNVITNLECVLRQSQDCLKTIEEQKQRHQLELQAAASSLSTSTTTACQRQPKASVFSKTELLLDGLSMEQRQQAERKIIKFLCECQIKEINNEEIEDLATVNIF